MLFYSNLESNIDLLIKRYKISRIIYVVLLGVFIFISANFLVEYTMLQTIPWMVLIDLIVFILLIMFNIIALRKEKINFIKLIDFNDAAKITMYTKYKEAVDIVIELCNEYNIKTKDQIKEVSDYYKNQQSKKIIGNNSLLSILIAATTIFSVIYNIDQNQMSIGLKNYLMLLFFTIIIYVIFYVLKQFVLTFIQISDKYNILSSIFSELYSFICQEKDADINKFSKKYEKDSLKPLSKKEYEKKLKQLFLDIYDSHKKDEEGWVFKASFCSILSKKYKIEFPNKKYEDIKNDINTLLKNYEFEIKSNQIKYNKK